MTELVHEKLTEPILKNFIISPDNLRVIGLGMEGDMFYKIHLANELFALGRLAPLEKVKKRNLIKAEIVSPEMETMVRLICENLFDPLDFDLIYNIIADVKPHTREIPSMLHAIGKASLNAYETVEIPMNTRHYTIHKIPKGHEKTDHQINETLFTNTNIYRIKAFLIIFSYFYYRVAASDGDNF